MRTLRICAAAAMLLVVPSLAMAEGHTSEFVGNKGYVGDDIYAKGYVAPQRRSHKRAHAPVVIHPVRHPKYIVAIPGCPAGYTGMFRGNIYCADGVRMH